MSLMPLIPIPQLEMVKVCTVSSYLTTGIREQKKQSQKNFI